MKILTGQLLRRLSTRNWHRASRGRVASFSTGDDGPRVDHGDRTHVCRPLRLRPGSCGGCARRARRLTMIADKRRITAGVLADLTARCKNQKPVSWFSWWPGPGSNRRPSAFRSRILDTPRWLPIVLCHNVVGKFILPVGSRRFSARRGYKRRISVNSGAVARRRSPLGFQRFGGSGTINYVTKSAVEMAVYATTTQAMNHLKRAVMN